MACDPQTMPQEAGCFGCIPPEYHAAVQTYLLARIRGGSMDVAEIMRDTTCMNCIPPAALPAIRSYLLCQLANTGGGSIPPSPECDADAAAFIAAAGITDDVQIGAVCVLVRDLKAYGTPAFWDSEVAIYPFVGGTAASHAVNLRNPGTFNLTYGAGLGAAQHGPLGMVGTGLANCYANTKFVPRTGPPATNINDNRWYSYIDSFETTIGLIAYGCSSDGALNRILQNSVAVPNRSNFQNCEQVTSGSVSVIAAGDYLNQNNPVGGTHSVAYNGGAFVTVAQTRTNSPRSELFLLAYNSNVVAPAINPTNMAKHRISGFSIGSRALSAAEWPIYHGIWQTYQANLGRARP